ncbi:MAG: type transporter [Phycisphaerales bacterium]|jgi:ABC-2 type transport system permease protein|nr:type transporter [Phycisphaerales bacterium]
MSTMTQTQSAVEPSKSTGGATVRKTGLLAKAPIIARRELFSYFVSPMAYVAMTLFLLACGFAFWQDFKPGQPALMRHLFDWMLWFLCFVVPMLCMGSISQEWASGTMEMMMTAPVTDSDVVVGKFMGAISFVCVLLAPTLVYVIMMASFSTSHVDLGPIFSGYLGMILAGSLFVAVSLFCSSLTRSQMVAAVSAFAILAVITIIPWLVGAWATLPDFWRVVINQGVYARYADFSKGVIDLGHVTFFVLMTAAFLFFTVKVLESRRWK